MEKIDGIDWALVSRAVVVYIGYDRLSFPDLDDDRVATTLGAEAAAAVLPIVHELSSDFQSSSAWRVAKDLTETGNIAAAEFKSRHPNVSDDAIKNGPREPGEKLARSIWA